MLWLSLNYIFNQSSAVHTIYNHLLKTCVILSDLTAFIIEYLTCIYYRSHRIPRSKNCHKFAISSSAKSAPASHCPNACSGVRFCLCWDYHNIHLLLRDIRLKIISLFILSILYHCNSEILFKRYTIYPNNTHT